MAEDFWGGVQPAFLRLLLTSFALCVGGLTGLWIHRWLQAQGVSSPRSPWVHVCCAAGCSAAYCAAWPLFPTHPVGAPFRALLFVLLLYAIACYDWFALSIESRLLVGGLFIWFILAALQGPLALQSSLLGAVCGAGSLYLVGLGFHALRGHSGLGEGDAGVLALIGAQVAPRGVLSTLVLAALLALLCGTILLRIRKQPLSTPLPFAPFLCLAGLFVALAQAHNWPLWP